MEHKASIIAEDGCDFPLNIAIMLRCLDSRDDRFVRENSYPVGQFRAERRRIFREAFRQTKRYLTRIQERRRDLDARSGNFDMKRTIENDLAFTRILFGFRAALALHYVNTSLAADLAGSACARLSLFVTSASFATARVERLSTT